MLGRARRGRGLTERKKKRGMLPKFLWTIPLLFNGSLLGVAACLKALSEPPPAPKPNSYAKKKKPAKKKVETKKLK